ncbi:hypothetical protein JCM11641_004799, partial [Rhodosporidiobolus odoratus]
IRADLGSADDLQFFVPLFFTSIGFSIPFLDLWTGRRIWRGVVYAILMALGKVLAGVPLLVVDAFSPAGPEVNGAVLVVREKRVAGQRPPPVTQAEMSRGSRGGAGDGPEQSRLATLPRDSLPAAAFLGLALVARGEIGTLVLQVAYSSSSASSTNPNPVLTEEPYLVGIWAVALCTIVGPVAFSALIRRVGERVVRGRWGLVGGEVRSNEEGRD